MNRKQFLINNGKSIFLSAPSPYLTGCNHRKNAAIRNERVSTTPGFKPEIELELSVVQAERLLFPGYPTGIYTYESRLIIERNTSGTDPEVWDTVKEGFLDEGWQDTFLLMPGMKVRVIMRFRDFSGMYSYHCHNLEHEDMGMMRNYRVEE